MDKEDLLERYEALEVEGDFLAARAVQSHWPRELERLRRRLA
jgi:hypothetical protein